MFLEEFDRSSNVVSRSRWNIEALERNQSVFGGDLGGQRSAEPNKAVVWVVAGPVRPRVG